MKLLTYQTDEGLKLGVKTERGILDVFKASRLFLTPIQEFPLTIEQVVKQGEKIIQALTDLVCISNESEEEGLFLDEQEIDFGPCVPEPGKIICVGLNYRKHAAESNMPIPDYPILFNKFSNAIAAHNEEIQIPHNARQVDYEAELAIVIGKRTKRAKKQDALSYVFGYCAANDISARDLQMRTTQWLLGKSFDGFSPLGPYLVTSDEVGDPNSLAIQTYLNGEIRQNSNTADMIFYCDEIVSYISQHITLEPGDVILTGTPEGVILGYPKEQQVWLQEGDVVAIQIDKLGRLVNRFVSDVISDIRGDNY